MDGEYRWIRMRCMIIRFSGIVLVVVSCHACKTEEHAILTGNSKANSLSPLILDIKSPFTTDHVLSTPSQTPSHGMKTPRQNYYYNLIIRTTAIPSCHTIKYSPFPKHLLHELFDYASSPPNTQTPFPSPSLLPISHMYCFCSHLQQSSHKSPFSFPKSYRPRPQSNGSPPGMHNPRRQK